MEIGDRIKDARERAGLTQTQLAEKVGVRYQSVQQWEAGATSPARAKMVKIAAALGVTVAFIEYGMDAVAEEAAVYAITDEAREIAQAWNALPEAKRRLYRDAILNDAAVATVFPEIGAQVAGSASYHSMIERIRRSRAKLEHQMKLKLDP